MEEDEDDDDNIFGDDWDMDDDDDGEGRKGEEGPTKGWTPTSAVSASSASGSSSVVLSRPAGDKPSKRTVARRPGSSGSPDGPVAPLPSSKRKNSGCRTGPEGEKLVGNGLQRGLVWANASVARADMLVAMFKEAATKAGLPKDKAIREQINHLNSKLLQLCDVSLGFMEDCLLELCE